MKNRLALRLVGGLTAFVTACALAACGGGGATPQSSPAENPYNLITPGVLRVGSLGDAKPYVYTEASGTWTGFDVELLENVAKREGITKFEWVGQDFSSLLAAVANKKYDVATACIGVTDERKKTIAYTDSFNNGFLIVIAKKTAGITDAAGLTGKRLGVIQGTVQEGYAKKNFTGANIVAFPDNNTVVQAVKSGTVDAGFLDNDTAKTFVKQYPELTESFKVTSDAPCAFVINKESTALQAALNKGLKEAIADGTVEELTKKWLPGSPLLPEYLPKKN